MNFFLILYNGAPSGKLNRDRPHQSTMCARLLAKSTLICVLFLKLKFSNLILCHHSYSKPCGTSDIPGRHTDAE